MNAADRSEHDCSLQIRCLRRIHNGAARPQTTRRGYHPRTPCLSVNIRKPPDLRNHANPAAFLSIHNPEDVMFHSKEIPCSDYRHPLRHAVPAPAGGQADRAFSAQRQISLTLRQAFRHAADRHPASAHRRASDPQALRARDRAPAYPVSVRLPLSDPFPARQGRLILPPIIP